MKHFVSVLALSFSIFFHAMSAHAATAAADRVSINGVWQGGGTLRGSDTIPMTLRISFEGRGLRVAFLNGPASHPVESVASLASFDGTHLVATFDYFARKLDATVTGDTLTGAFESVSVTSKTAPIAFTVTRSARDADPPSAAGAPDLHGVWEVATNSEKGEKAWELRIDPATEKSGVVRAVIQRVDGDTGSLWGSWDGTRYTFSHFIASGAALYAVTPKEDGTLVVKNLIPPAPKAGETVAAVQPELVARRPAEARKARLAPPTDPTQNTSVKDPKVPFTFSFPDMSGKTVSNTDAAFRGKVVIVALGGSWCPNCHDEAPFLVSLYKHFHARGLEIVDLDFEQGDPETDAARLKVFIARYGIPYPVLFAGSTEEVEQKIPQGVNLNSWPTSFFLGRDGRVREVHAGFAGPANPEGHEKLIQDVTALVEKLLAEPAPNQVAGQ